MTSRPRPALGEIFVTWFGFGIQSFGGGSSTFLLMRQASVRRGWMSEEEFAQAWALVQLSPGINLIKLTVLLSRSLRGWPGIVTAMAGLLVPSALVTALMTAGYTAIRDQPYVRAALHGVVPATIGLSLTMAIQMAQPLLTRARREGKFRLAAHLVVLTGAALLLAVGGVTPLAVLVLSGAILVVALAPIPALASPAAPEEKR